MKGKFILTRVLTLEHSGDLKRIQLELQILDYSIYTILAKTYQPIGYEPEIRDKREQDKEIRDKR